MFEQPDKKVAVALLYDRIKAPKVTAKGTDTLAEEIIAIAEEAGVAISEDPLLAETLSQLEINSEIFKDAAVALDLYYSQKDTLFMKMAKDQSVPEVFDGWGMLVQQAAESFLQWTGLEPDTSELIRSRGA